MSRLDDMIARARQLPVNEAGAQRYVAELGRWGRAAHRAEPRRSRARWFGFGFALTAVAAAIVIVVVRFGDPTADPAATLIGDRVAIVAEPNARYRVLAADADRTEVFVERGTITARLWPGASPHRLSLRADGIEAVATGTVYALQVDARGASVHVHEGKVWVTRGSEHAQVAAGASWPPGAAHHDRHAADRLLALAAPPNVASATAPTTPPGILADAPMLAPDAAAPDAVAPHIEAHARPPDAGVVLSLTQRWRQARMLRGQGNFDAALAECLAIADAKDAMWSPIALLEAARIELGPRAAPERAVALADRFEAEWAAHQLAPEARELRCRALRQLGRPDECKPHR